MVGWYGVSSELRHLNFPCTGLNLIGQCLIICAIDTFLPARFGRKSRLLSRRLFSTWRSIEGGRATKSPVVAMLKRNWELFQRERSDNHCATVLIPFFSAIAFGKFLFTAANTARALFRAFGHPSLGLSSSACDSAKLRIGPYFFRTLPRQPFGLVLSSQLELDQLRS